VDESKFPVVTPECRRSASDIVLLTSAAGIAGRHLVRTLIGGIQMRLTTSAALLLALSSTAAFAQAPVTSRNDVKWGPAPAVFSPGAQMAVLQGDPSSNKLFTVRLRFPNNYRVMPHTHPTDEHVTVIAGTFVVGMGDKIDLKTALTLKGGGFVTAPANHAHYGIARGETIVQVHAMGPFALTYVNPADNPAASASR
jgi:quercetin dioxygenase-like cupin family protein